MNARIVKVLAAVFGLTLAVAPLAASAQGYAVRGGYVARGGWNHGFVGDRFHAGFRGGYRAGFVGGPVRFGAVAYAHPFINGYYGWAPGGFYGYYWNGGWYHSRRWHAGVWLYF
jgi:hypothetical protein